MRILLRKLDYHHHHSNFKDQRACIDFEAMQMSGEMNGERVFLSVLQTILNVSFY